MERIVFLIIYMMTYCIQSSPIDNGFTIKLKPSKQDGKTKGAVFAKRQLDYKFDEDQSMWDAFNKLFFTEAYDAARDYAKQDVKFEVPPKRAAENVEGDVWPLNKVNFLNLPVINQQYDDYKVLVAAAPPNMNMGPDKKKMVVYVVFPEDGLNGESNLDDIPKVYFVKENNAKKKVPKKVDTEPILIVDSNRTVTGLKSKEVPKFVRFKNKLNRFNYTITR